MPRFEKFKSRYLRLHAAAAAFFALLLAAVFSAPLLPHRCPFQLFFRIYCPGCGGTRALRALLGGHPIRSFLLSPPLWFLLFLLVFGEAVSVAALFRRDDSFLKTAPIRRTRNALLLLFVIGTAIHFLLRNILLFFGIDPLGDLLF